MNAKNIIWRVLLALFILLGNSAFVKAATPEPPVSDGWADVRIKRNEPNFSWFITITEPSYVELAVDSRRDMNPDGSNKDCNVSGECQKGEVFVITWPDGTESRSEDGQFLPLVTIPDLSWSGILQPGTYEIKAKWDGYAFKGPGSVDLRLREDQEAVIYSVDASVDCPEGKVAVSTNVGGTFEWQISQDGIILESGSEHITASSSKSVAWALDQYGPYNVKAWGEFTPDDERLDAKDDTDEKANLTCGVDEEPVKVLVYGHETYWEEGPDGLMYPFTRIYTNKPLHKYQGDDEDNESDGLGTRTAGDFGRSWDQPVTFKQFYVVCVTPDHCRVRKALTVPGIWNDDVIASGRNLGADGAVSIGREGFTGKAKSEKASTINYCTLQEYKANNETCP
ncbi:MAG: hypothetical protein UV73_C0005G0035 [Candidatus Gottesmanbacteria bacterium GW2011_GWA2_43_14]|uniref:Uncharacterized protein n=1 Tax=Candidatus Gottesmanbacteria bacterium GW2011_GWA2_43_14 TaxID=1618443 RepID=A0A0G1GG04_9BACT|nr:MAG: hypothetical protein UV73_C0005G0035 [Candidatus Gottesmanbacteria bacterium GW2011_GWA2_43_14]